MSKETSRNVVKQKDKVFQIRVDEEMHNMIDLFSKRLKIKKSELARQAIYKFILTMTNTNAPNQKIMISHNIFKPLIDHASPQLIQQIAEVSFNNGYENIKFYQLHYKEFLNGKFRLNNFRELMETMISVIFSNDKQNWFYSVTCKEKGASLIISGTHPLGNNFSVFFKHLITRYANSFDYDLFQESNEEISRTVCTQGKNQSKSKIYKVILEYIKKSPKMSVKSEI